MPEINWAALWRQAKEQSILDCERETPSVGFWAVALVNRGPLVPVAIMRIETASEPGEPENDMRGTRSPFLAAFIAGEIVGIDDVRRLLMAAKPIIESEYAFRVADLKYAQRYAPDEAQAQPHKPVDWLQAALPF